MHPNLSDLKNENADLKLKIESLQNQVQSISNDVLVLQNRFSINPRSLESMGVKSESSLAKEKNIPSKISFFDTELMPVEDEPSLKLSNMNLAQKPPLNAANRGLNTPINSPIEMKGLPLTNPPLNDANKAKQLYQEAYASVTSGRYDQAIAKLDGFVELYPNHDLTDNAFYWKGESLFQQKKYEMANQVFKIVVSQFSSGNKVPDSLYRSAICYSKLQLQDKSKEVIGELISRYPTSVAAQKAKQSMGEPQ